MIKKRNIIKPDQKDEVQCLNTKHIYQNIKKQQPREKFWTIPFLLESPRSKELEFQPPDLEIDFLIDSGSEKTYSNFTQNFYFPNAQIWIKVLCNDCIICQLNKPYPNQKQLAQKQDFKGQSLYFNISFDTFAIF